MLFQKRPFCKGLLKERVVRVANTDQVRSVKFEGNRLILRGEWVLAAVMYQPSGELVWERLKPEATNR